ncbi:hypothetical protein L3X38_024747 [Prunus dulcis]|uniref:Uncharacterized protein n=1 Tax=Prunus dulcis TaxID=3755 RepID=A0AAD4Z6T3_PRUDU|nr:hypothetical protein L3X38_024747 [Prunus dulcis]
MMNEHVHNIDDNNDDEEVEVEPDHSASLPRSNQQNSASLSNRNCKRNADTGIQKEMAKAFGEMISESVDQLKTITNSLMKGSKPRPDIAAELAKMHLSINDQIKALRLILEKASDERTFLTLGVGIETGKLEHRIRFKNVIKKARRWALYGQRSDTTTPKHHHPTLPPHHKNGRCQNTKCSDSADLVTTEEADDGSISYNKCTPNAREKISVVPLNNNGIHNKNALPYMPSSNDILKSILSSFTWKSPRTPTEAYTTPK